MECSSSQYTLDVLQKRLFAALCKFDDLCMQAGCQYSLMCGTLLGAVRHQGFIPWDDDVDIVMFRSEYEKLRRYCLSSNDLRQVYLDEGDTWVPRIRTDGSKEIFVDIFILDRVSENLQAHKRTLLKLKLLQGMMKKDIFYKRYSFKNKLLIFFTNLIGKRIPFSKKYKKYHDIATRSNNCKTNKYYIADGAFDVLPLIWEEKEFQELTRATFYGREFLITSQYKTVLTRLYGPTYMELPPEEERVPKHN